MRFFLVLFVVIVLFGSTDGQEQIECKKTQLGFENLPLIYEQYVPYPLKVLDAVIQEFGLVEIERFHTRDSALVTYYYRDQLVLFEVNQLDGYICAYSNAVFEFKEEISGGRKWYYGNI